MKNDRKLKDVTQDKRNDKNGDLPVKVFEPRASVLTNLYQDKNIKAVYNIFIALFCTIILSTTLHNYVYKNEFNMGLRLIKNGFSQLHIFMVVWISLLLLVFLFFCVFKLWTQISVSLQPKSFLLQFWKNFGLLCLLLYYSAILYFATVSMVKFKFGLACSFATTMEVTRFLMKVHSFVRSNVPKIFQHQKNKDKTLYPKFSTYLYFLFAPTLIYKDVYPRSKEQTNWKNVTGYAIEFVSGVLMLNYIFDTGFIPYTQDFGLKPYTAGDVLMIVLKCFPYGLLVVFTVFYLGLHVWCNIFAEIMGFSDRLFYKDWWTSTTYGEYYRKWNVVVHDWLYTYVYKDFYENVVRNKVLARCLVFFISGVFHEYVFSFACGFCLPVVIVQMFLTVILMEVSKLLQSKVANSILWFSLGFGLSLNSTVYLIEYYARINCPVPSSELSKYDIFIPRFLSCYK